MASLAVLKVYLHNREIGQLSQLPGDRNLFVFGQGYIEDENRPTLSLSFKDKLGELVTQVKPTQTALPPFFSNLLPEGKLRDYLAKHAGVKSKREFYLLWALGLDLPGAIKIIPADDNALQLKTIEPEERSQEMDTTFHFSLAGVQLKFPAIKNAQGNMTIPVNGVGGSWILKLPDTRFHGVPENEFAMMELARKIGIDVPKTILIPLTKISGLPSDIQQLNTHAYAIKRFDRRDDGTAVHIEDFAQIFGIYPDKKYKIASYRNIAEVIWRETGEVGIIEFIKRLVFNTLIGNADMHVKNWSLIYPDGRNAALAPAYDFVSTIPYIHDDEMALSFVDSRAFKDMTMAQFKRFAVKVGLQENLVIDTVNETLEKFAQYWPSVSEIGLDQKIIHAIEHHLRNLPLYH